MENQTRNVCPLLQNPELYIPDTVDLLVNVRERRYWLPCLDQMIKKFISKAPVLNPEDPLAQEKAERCYQQFHGLIEQVTADPNLIQPLSVRLLLEFNEDNLRKNSFKDAWLLQKQKESELAFNQFKQRIEFIDSISNFYDRWLEIIKGVLAGNVFDWGSKAVADILENSNDFGLIQAMGTIQQRPWFQDDFDKLVDKLQVHSYKCLTIFVDNAGVDFILGILPLVREFLKMDTEVILAANSLPALNDVTYRELKIYTCTAAQYCKVIKDGIQNGTLITTENGQKGPCLNLLNLPESLCSLMAKSDLIILEGMGRAVHTNFFAKFNVDSLKLAVLKNEWLAKSLGASQFNVICDFQPVM